MDESNKTDTPATDKAPEADDLDAFTTTDVPREGAGRALLHIIIGAVIFAGATAVYLWEANRAHKAQSLVFEARPLVEMADVANLKAAIEKYDEALDTKGGYDKAVAGQAEAYTLLWVDHGLEDYRAQAMQYIEEAVDDNIERGERYGAEALAAYGEGRHDDAIRISKSILDKGGVSERLNYAMGLAQRAKGELKKGRDNLRKAQDSKSGAPHYAVKLADAYDEDGNHHNAGHFWAMANTINTNYVPAAAGHVKGQARKGGDPQLLMEELQRLTSMPPEQLGTHDRAAIEVARSEVFYNQGLTREAVKAANKAIEYDGETAVALYARGVARVADGKLEKGFKDLVKVREMVPGSTRYFYGLAKLYHENGKHEAALKVLREPDRQAEHVQEPEYHTLVGDVERDAGDFEKAMGSYDKALKINTEYAPAFLGKATVLWRQKDYDGSLKWFEKAVAARPQYPEVYESIGLMWFEQRAGDQANIQIQEAERQYNKQNANRLEMARFYKTVLEGLVANRASSTHVNEWVEKEKAFREAAPKIEMPKEPKAPKAPKDAKEPKEDAPEKK